MDSLHGYADIRLGPKLPSIMKAEDRAVANTSHQPFDHCIGLPIPIIADHCPHNRRQSETPLRAVESEPADTERGAEPCGRGAGMLRNGLLGAAQFSLNEIRRPETEEWMAVTVVSDLVTCVMDEARDGG